MFRLNTVVESISERNERVIMILKHWILRSRCLVVAVVFADLLPLHPAQATDTTKTLMIPMRDGVELATDLYFPASEAGRFPVILMRTPYDKVSLQEYGEFYSEHGYVLAAQDVRGRCGSGGAWEPFVHEGQDGHDAIEWLAMQPWSTGKVGMIGGSYSGSVQFAAAIKRPTHLVTIIPNITPAMPFDNLPYQGGVFSLGWAIRWCDIVENAHSPSEIAQRTRENFGKDWHQLLNHLPAIDLDQRILGKEIPYWREWLKHERNDSYWNEVNYLEDLEALDIPVFLQSGWYDGGNRGTKLAYSSLKKSQNKYIKMIIGPWVHSDRSSRYLHGFDMGEFAAIDLFGLYRRWFDYWLKGKENGILEEPLVQIYNVGSGHWLEANEYPLPNTSFTKFYLTSDRGANTSRGDGMLQLEEPSSAETFDHYSYDPGDPSPDFYAYLKNGMSAKFEQLAASRQDMLVYETKPLEHPLTIAGPLSAVLYASSSAKDTDWFVTIYGVDSGGVSYPLGMTWGGIRGRFRNSTRVPELLEENVVYRYVIDLSHTGVTLSPGERIRLVVTSASFPEYSRNLNTGGHNEMETDYVVADQKVYHSRQYPSHLVLPVVGRDYLSK